MAINKESNIYTILFATVMVFVVGGLLAFISMSLRPLQKENALNEKKQNIIQATGFIENKLDVTRKNASELFAKYVVKRITIDFEGNILDEKEGDAPIDVKDEKDAFNIDLRKERANIKDKKNRNYPIFICENEGETVYVLSCSGKGLWDDIWGYVGLESDGKTIKATIFDHKGETPGLGSVITEDWFQEQFEGKLIEKNGQFQPIKVLKPGAKRSAHDVDGISGGTFTGVGVDEMMARNFEVYYNFFKQNTAEYIK